MLTRELVLKVGGGTILMCVWYELGEKFLKPRTICVGGAKLWKIHF